MSSPNDKRLEMMLGVIQKFLRGSITLRAMTLELEDLYLSLDVVEEQWGHLFYKEWAVLNDAYSVAADRGLSEHSEPFASHVQCAIPQRSQFGVGADGFEI